MPGYTPPFPSFDPNNPQVPQGWDEALVDTASDVLYSPSKMGNDIAYFLSGYAEKVSSSLITQLSPVITTCVIIYFIFSGWMVLAGRSQNTIGDTVIKATKISFIAYFGLNAGNFINFVLPTVQGLEVMLSKAIGNQNSAWLVLDTFFYNLWYTVSDVGGAFLRNLFQDFSFFGDDGLLELLIIFLFVFAMAIIGSFTTFVITMVLLAATIGLPIILGFGPLFICTLMFPVTRQWFDGWLRSAVGLIFTLIIAVSLVSLLDHITMQQIKAIKAMQISNTSIAEFQGRLAFLMFVMAAILVIFFKISSISSALVGGLSLSSLNLGDLGSQARTVDGLKAVGNIASNAIDNTQTLMSKAMLTMMGCNTPRTRQHGDVTNNNQHTNSAINNIANSAANTGTGVAKERAQVNGATPNYAFNSQAAVHTATDTNHNAPKEAPANTIDINAHRAYGFYNSANQAAQNSNQKTV